MYMVISVQFSTTKNVLDPNHVVEICALFQNRLVCRHLHPRHFSWKEHQQNLRQSSTPSNILYLLQLCNTLKYSLLIGCDCAYNLSKISCFIHVDTSKLNEPVHKVELLVLDVSLDEPLCKKRRWEILFEETHSCEFFLKA